MNWTNIYYKRKCIRGKLQYIIFFWHIKIYMKNKKYSFFIIMHGLSSLINAMYSQTCNDFFKQHCIKRSHLISSQFSVPNFFPFSL